MTDPMLPRVLADFAADAVRCGLLTPDRVIAWADGLVATVDGPPPPWLMDLSLADPSDGAAVCAALSALPGAPDATASDRLLNALVWRERATGRLTDDRVVAIGRLLFLSRPDPDRYRHWGVQIDDSADLHDVGILTADDLRHDIDTALATFAVDADRLPTWA